MIVFVEFFVFIGKFVRCLIVLMSLKNFIFFIFYIKVKCSNVILL